MTRPGSRTLNPVPTDTLFLSDRRMKCPRGTTSLFTQNPRSVHISPKSIGIAFISYALYRLFTITTGMVVGISIIFLLIITFSRRVRRQSRRLENGFNSNLTARETSAEDKRPMGKHFVTRLLPYDLHISDFTVPSDSTFSGKTLRELNLRQKSGVSVVRIIRAGIHTNIPGGSKHIYPGDRIVVAGTDEQIDKFKKMLDNNRHIEENPNTDRTHFTLESMVIESNSTLIGQTIQESGIFKIWLPFLSTTRKFSVDLIASFLIILPILLKNPSFGAG